MLNVQSIFLFILKKFFFINITKFSIIVSLFNLHYLKFVIIINLLLFRVLKTEIALSIFLKSNKFNLSKMTNKKTIFTGIMIGIKKGIFTPTLPQNILNFQRHPLIRILRFLGGMSLLFIMSKIYTIFPFYFLYIAYFISLLFLIYQIGITYYRIKHIYKLFKSGELETRNSP